MALTIESGAIVAEADSYASVAELVAAATAYGKTVPNGNAEREALLRRAAIAMDTMAWKGDRVNSAQVLAWPRAGVVRDGFELSGNTIPGNIKKGQIALALEIYADDLAPPELKKGAVVREKVEGAVEKEYAAAVNYARRPAIGRLSSAFFTGFIRGDGGLSLVRG
ncbi:MAG: DnaT-like ssDNA-binding protein [Moraxellaceae bacterium]